MDFIALSLLKLSAACITGESTPSIKSDSIFVLQNHGLTTKAVKGFKTGKFDKRIKGLVTSLHERALTISCLFSTTSNVFSQPNPLQSLSLLCWAPTHRPTGVLFFKEAARLGALGTKHDSKMARGRHGSFSLVFHLFCKVSGDYRWIKHYEQY